MRWNLVGGGQGHLRLPKTDSSPEAKTGSHNGYTWAAQGSLVGQEALSVALPCSSMALQSSALRWGCYDCLGEAPGHPQPGCGARWPAGASCRTSRSHPQA